MSDKWDFVVTINDGSDPVEALVVPLDRSSGREPKYYNDYRAEIDRYGARDELTNVYPDSVYEEFAIYLVDNLFRPSTLTIEAEVRWKHGDIGPYLILLDVRLCV